MKILYKPYWDWTFRKFDLPDKSKTIDHQRLSSVCAVEETVKNFDLALKHNELIKQLEKIRREISDVVNQMEKHIKR